MADRQAIADEIFSVSEGSLATHKVWLLVNFIERMLADRPEAPAQTSCDNSSGQKVIAVPSCVPAPVCSKCGNTLGCVSCYNEAHAPAERMFTVEQMREVGRKFQWEHTVEKIIAALDPPKPKMPEKSVEVFSMGVNIEGCERVWVVLVDKNPNHPLSCYGLREDVAKAYGSTLRAELAKERP